MWNSSYPTMRPNMRPPGRGPMFSGPMETVDSSGDIMSYNPFLNEVQYTIGPKPGAGSSGSPGGAGGPGAIGGNPVDMMQGFVQRRLQGRHPDDPGILSDAQILADLDSYRLQQQRNKMALEQQQDAINERKEERRRQQRMPGPEVTMAVLKGNIQAGGTGFVGSDGRRQFAPMAGAAHLVEGDATPFQLETPKNLSKSQQAEVQMQRLASLGDLSEAGERSKQFMGKFLEGARNEYRAEELRKEMEAKGIYYYKSGKPVRIGKPGEKVPLSPVDQANVNLVNAQTDKEKAEAEYWRKRPAEAAGGKGTLTAEEANRDEYFNEREKLLGMYNPKNGGPKLVKQIYGTDDFYEIDRRLQEKYGINAKPSAGVVTAGVSAPAPGGGGPAAAAPSPAPTPSPTPSAAPAPGPSRSVAALPNTFDIKAYRPTTKDQEAYNTLLKLPPAQRLSKLQERWDDAVRMGANPEWLRKKLGG